MEPANLNSPDPADDRLEALLRQKRSAPLADGGFSARVVAALPPGENRRWVGVRISLLTTAALAGLAVALAQGGHWIDLTTQLEQAVAAVSDQLADPQISLALAITAASLALALNFDDPPETQPE